MLKVQEIRELIKLVDQSSIDEFNYEHEGSKIKMKKNNGVTTVANQLVQAQVPAQVTSQVQAPVAEAPALKEQPKAEQVEVVQAVKKDDSNLHKITSPMVGTFYSTPNPDAKAYVAVGDKVKKDSVVCIVEAMKLFNEIEAEVNGEIVEILVENGQLVEYGQPMFLVKPE
jgi:acetyl-CoA carboxylase biotin carboxyl carrier protein